MRKGKGKDNSLRNSTQDTETTARASKPLFDAVIREIPNVHPYAKMVLGVLSSAAKTILTQVDRDAAIVTGSEDKTVRLWDAGMGEPVGEPLRRHTHSVWSASFSPDGTRIATGSPFKGDSALLGGGDIAAALSNRPCPISASFISSHFCRVLHYLHPPVISTVA